MPHAEQYPIPPDQNPLLPLLGEGVDLADHPACQSAQDVLQVYYDIIILLQQAGTPAPSLMPWPDISSQVSHPVFLSQLPFNLTQGFISRLWIAQQGQCHDISTVTALEELQ